MVGRNVQGMWGSCKLKIENFNLIDNSKSPEFNKKRMQKASFFVSIYQNFREKLPET